MCVTKHDVLCRKKNGFTFFLLHRNGREEVLLKKKMFLFLKLLYNRISSSEY